MWNSCRKIFFSCVLFHTLRFILSFLIWASARAMTPLTAKRFFSSVRRYAYFFNRPYVSAGSNRTNGQKNLKIRGAIDTHLAGLFLAVTPNMALQVRCIPAAPLLVANPVGDRARPRLLLLGLLLGAVPGVLRLLPRPPAPSGLLALRGAVLVAAAAAATTVVVVMAVVAAVAVCGWV